MRVVIGVLVGMALAMSMFRLMDRLVFIGVVHGMFLRSFGDSCFTNRVAHTWLGIIYDISENRNKKRAFSGYFDARSREISIPRRGLRRGAAHCYNKRRFSGKSPF